MPQVFLVTGMGGEGDLIVVAAARQILQRQLRIDSIRELHSATANKFRDDLLRGVVVHRRLPRLVRALPLCVLALDLAVLYTFCADLFNVPGFETVRINDRDYVLVITPVAR
ncbi:MAG: hypothetical protein LCH57_09370 [Proteobacteria bacterium]|nr:hypothetical protein [Pseudomonadota bacterium]